MSPLLRRRSVSTMEESILVVCPEIPYPADSGSRIDMWGHIQFFHRAGWRVVVAVCWTSRQAASRGSQDADWPAQFELRLVQRRSIWSTRENPRVTEQVQELVDRHRPQVVWCEYAHLAPLASVLNLRGAKLWFRSHNFEAAHSLEKALEQRPRRTWGGWSGLRQAWHWGRTLWRSVVQVMATERLMHRIADRIFFISYGDLRAMTWLYRGLAGRSWVIPFLEREPIPVKHDKTPLDVVYAGSNYSNNVNLAGARKLLTEIAPAVEESMPDAFRFHLVGRGGTERLGRYASRTIVVHDYVDDLRAFLQEMDVACVPVNLGWGCKLKMVEALASGLPVIGAPQTFRGIPSVPGAYYACRTGRQYVAAFRALRSEETRRRIAWKGRTAYNDWLADGERTLLRALADSVRTEPMGAYPENQRRRLTRRHGAERRNPACRSDRQ